MHHTAVSTVKDVQSNVQRRLAWVAGTKGTVFDFVACIASVSNQVIARKLEREQKKAESPVLHLFLLLSQLSRRTRSETLAT